MYPIDEVLALTDVDFVKLMKEHRNPDGTFGAPIANYFQLTAEEKAKLAERILAHQKALTHDEDTFATRLDLAQLDKRLEEAASGDTEREFDYWRQRSGTPTASANPEADIREAETYAYEELLRDGGRPLYPISSLEDILTFPEDHFDILKPYQESKELSREVFQTQLKRWDDFRKWQVDNRGKQDGDLHYQRFVDEYTRDNRQAGKTDELAKIDADPAYLRPKFEEWLRRTREKEHRRWRRERKLAGFSDYEAKIKHRMAGHGFNRPFSLKESPEQQDTLTTWIEYLGFEYWWLDEHRRCIEDLKAPHDEEWAKLVKNGDITDKNDTSENIRGWHRALGRQRERDWARERVEAAEFELTRMKDKKNITPKERADLLKILENDVEVAHSRRDTDNSRLDRVSDFIRGTVSYYNVKLREKQQHVLLEWVLNQIPLIEAETGVRPTPNSGKRLVAFEEPHRNAKRQRSETELPPTTNGGKSHAAHTISPPVLPSQEAAASVTETLPPRRSARVAAQQNGATQAVHSPPESKQRVKAAKAKAATAKPAATAKAKPAKATPAKIKRAQAKPVKDAGSSIDKKPAPVKGQNKGKAKRLGKAKPRVQPKGGRTGRASK